MQHRIDAGAVIRRVFEIYVDQASVLMPAAAVVFVFTGIISGVLITASASLALVALIISLIAGTLFTGMVVELVADVQDGRRDASPGQLLQAVTPVLGQLLLVGIVAGIGIVIGLVLIIVPGLFLLTIWFVAAPVVVLERPGVLAALGRSRALVRGNGWQVFGVILVVYVLVGVISFILDGIADSAGSGIGIVVRVIIGVLTAPLLALAASVLYFELGGSAATQPAAAGVGGFDPGALAAEPDPIDRGADRPAAGTPGGASSDAGAADASEPGSGGSDAERAFGA